MMKPHGILCAFATAWMLGWPSAGLAVEFYVSPSGSDTAAGTKEQPFRSLEKARDAVRAWRKSAGAKPEAATVWLRGGRYLLDKTLLLTPEDSGRPGAPVCYRAFPGETPKLLGGRTITDWKKLGNETEGVADAAKGKLWVAGIPKGWRFHYLFVDGVPLPRAKLHNTHWRQWPADFTCGAPTKDGQPVRFKNPGILKHVPGNGDTEMVCIMTQYGVMGNGVLTHTNPDAGTAVWNSTQTHLGFRTRDPNRYTLENALPFIDQPGEWCVDSAAGKVYCWPPSGDLSTSRVLAPELYELIRLQGDEARQMCVEHVTVDGLTLAYTDRLPEDQWPANWIRRQWEHVDAMIFVEWARDCVFSNNRLLHSGASGITLNQFCQGIGIEGNEIGWPGSNGVSLCGYGPGTLDVNKGNTITRNWIHDMGQGNYWHSAAIQIYQSGHNQITLNLLQRSAYTCISMVGASPTFLQDPEYFFQDNPGDANRQFKLWSMFGIRSQDFPPEIQSQVRARKAKFDRETLKPYIHTNANLIENNIVVEPEQLLDEGGAIYAWCTGKGNIWRDNLVFKSSGMPGSSILALDDMAEYFSITGNVIWVEGRAACGTIGVRPSERGNVIHGNIRACYKPEHADRTAGNLDGLAKGFYSTDANREPVDRLLKTITDKVDLTGGWLGNPKSGVPGPGEPVRRAQERVLPGDAHKTIE